MDFIFQQKQNTYNMRKLAIFFLFILCLYSCESRRETPVKTPTEASKPTLAEEKAETPTEINLTQFDGFTIGNGVRLRASADLKSEKLAELPYGLLVKILDKTARKSINKSDDCNNYGYPWFKVQTADGKEGWVFGAYLATFEKVNDPNFKQLKKLQGAIYKFKDEPYIFGAAFDNSYTSIDTDGPTGCEDSAMPFLYKAGENSVRPIFSKATKGRDWQISKHKNGYWQLITNEHIAEDAHHFLQILYGIRLSYAAQLYDGTATGTIEITEANNKFYAAYTQYVEKKEEI